MKLRFTALLIGGVLAAQAWAADETAEARAARYYAQGLELPLEKLRAGAMLIQACHGRMRAGCDRQQAQHAGDNHVIPLLDALTLFPARADAASPAPASRPKELRQKIDATAAELMRTAGEYDLELFARYGATLFACPPEDHVDAYHGALISLRVIDLVGFQGMTADQAQVAEARHSERLHQEIEAWHSRPSEDCIAARTLGEFLMELMVSKLQPWSKVDAPPAAAREFDFDQPKKEPPRTPSPAEARELAQAVAGNFASVVATELQLRVFPESAPRIKALADQAGFPSQD